MKTFSGRLLTMLLAVAMVFGLSGMTAFAAEADDTGTPDAAAETKMLSAEEGGVMPLSDDTPLGDSPSGTLSESGTYTLTDDYSTGSSVWVPEGVDVTIDLNGHVLTLSHPASTSVYITVQGTLTIKDSSREQSGYITRASSSWPVIRVFKTGVLNLESGGVKNVNNSNNFNDNESDMGGAVYITGGEFNMYGGSISGNRTYGICGGAVVLSDAVFNMYGGEITNNAGARGGAVYFYNGTAFSTSSTFNMFGGSITGNKSTRGSGGAIYSIGKSWDPCVINLFGGTITGNSASIESSNPDRYVAYGGGIYAEYTEVNITEDDSLGTKTYVYGNSAETGGADIYIGTSGGYECTVRDQTDGRLRIGGYLIDGWYYDNADDRWSEDNLTAELEGYTISTDNVALIAAHKELPRDATSDINVSKEDELLTTLRADDIAEELEGIEKKEFTYDDNGSPVKVNASFIKVSDLLGEYEPDEGCGVLVRTDGTEGERATFLDLDSLYLYDDSANGNGFRTAVDGASADLWQSKVVGIVLGHYYEDQICVICGDVDKRSLQEEYDTDIKKKEADYTEESWAPFQAALEEAKDVLDDEGATVDQVNDALAVLQDARDGLEHTAEYYKVEYAVRIWGIQTDTYSYDEGKNLENAGLTFGPALGDNDSGDGTGYLNTYKAHIPEDQCDPEGGLYCIHWMSWQEIIDQCAENPLVFKDCKENGCTKSVELTATSKFFNLTAVENAIEQGYTGDGVSTMMYLLNGTGAIIPYSNGRGLIWNKRDNYSSNADQANVYSRSRIRNSLTGDTTVLDKYLDENPDAYDYYGYDTLCTEEECLLTNFPEELQEAIVPRTTVNYGTGGGGDFPKGIDKTTTYDKLFLYSMTEVGYNYGYCDDGGTNYGLFDTGTQNTDIRRVAYEYYNASATTVAKQSWWSRARFDTTNVAFIMNTSGTGQTMEVTYGEGFSPGFCLPGPKEVRGDKDELQKEYDADLPTLENTDPNDNLYTEDSWSAFEDAMEQALEVLEKEAPTQKEVDQALAALQSAKASLHEYTDILVYDTDGTLIGTITASTYKALSIKADTQEFYYTGNSGPTYVKAKYVLIKDLLEASGIDNVTTVTIADNTVDADDYYLYYETTSGSYRSAASGERGSYWVSGVTEITVSTDVNARSVDYDVKYAVTIWGINADVDEEGTPIGLTFGPATRQTYIGTQKFHIGEDKCDPDNGVYCIHWMSWEEISEQAKKDPTVFQACFDYGCTLSVKITLNDTLRAESFDGQMTGDGIGVLHDSINATYLKWNSSSSVAGGWPASQVRAVLNGKDDLLGASAANALDAEDCLLSCFPKGLRENIVPKAVKSDTVYNSQDEENVVTTYDKLWLLSVSECYGPSGDSNYDKYLRSNEGEQYAYAKQYSITTAGSTDLKNCKETGGNVATDWWLRTLNPSANNQVLYITPNNLSLNVLDYVSPSGVSYGISPCFCLGLPEKEPTVRVTIESSLKDEDDEKTYDGDGVTLTALLDLDPEDARVSFQWYKDDGDGGYEELEGETGSKLTLAGDVADSGTYRCEVTAENSAGTDSDTGEITITIHPAAQEIYYENSRVEANVYDPSVTNELKSGKLSTDGTAGILYSSEDPAVATVDPTTGEVTIVGPGTTTITATAEATDNFAEYTASYELVVVEDSIDTSIEVAGTTATWDGGKEAWTAERTYSSDPFWIEAEVSLTGEESDYLNDVTYQWYRYVPDETDPYYERIEDATDAVLMVTDAGAGEHTYVCLATVAYLNGYEHTVSVTAVLTIDKAPQDISYEQDAIERMAGTPDFTNPLTKTTVSTDEDAGITYTSDNPAVATVDPATGEVTITGPGCAKITATAAATDNYEAAEASYDLLVVEDSFDVEIDVGDSPAEWDGDKEEWVDTLTYSTEPLTIEIKITLTEEEAENLSAITYQWYRYVPDETDPYYEKIEGAKDTALTVADAGAGDHIYLCETTVTYRNGYAHTVYSPIEITIAKADQEISYEHTTLTATVGDTVKNDLTKTKVSTDADAKITYVSGDETIATVDEEGTVTLLAIGEVTITATAEETANFNEASANYTINISAVDKDALEEAIDTAEGLDESDYTPETWETLKEALQKAEEVYADDKALQSEVDAATEALNDAIKGLETRPVEKDALEASIAQAEALHEEDYTPDSWAALEKALVEAQAVDADSSAKQDAVDAACDALTKAIGALVVLPVDKEVLEATIEIAGDLTESDYTEKSWETLAGALDKAKEVFADETAKQSDVNQAEIDLIAAIAGLEGVGGSTVSNADKEKLLDAYAEGRNLTESDYTAESWEQFEAALSDAENVLLNVDATQEEVDAACDALTNAMDSLVNKPATSEPTPGSGGTPKNGLYRIESGVRWGYYVNDVVDTSFTGFVSNENGDWYVQNGYVVFADPSESGVFKDKIGTDGDKGLGTKGTWYYVVRGKVQHDFTGLANYKNEKGWWYIKNGVVDFTHNGVDKNKNGWWYVVRGKVRFNFTGLAHYRNANGWWYIKNGKVDFTHNGVDKNQNGWWYVVRGKVRFNFTGLAHYKNQNGWWYVSAGKVTFDYNGIASNQNGTWYLTGSKVRFDFTGTVRAGGATYTVVNGRVR